MASEADESITLFTKYGQDGDLREHLVLFLKQISTFIENTIATWYSTHNGRVHAIGMPDVQLFASVGKKTPGSTCAFHSVPEVRDVEKCCVCKLTIQPA